jgi:hypothetical protein
LAEQILRDQDAQRERERARGEEQRRNRSTHEGLDPFNTVWGHGGVGPHPGYLPRTPMRMGKVGFCINCRGCGRKFESKGMAYCEPCMLLPAEERRAMKPIGRPCEAPGCPNIVAPTVRADTRYCSQACRQKALRERSRNEKGAELPDTAPPENVTDNVEKK